MDLAVDTKLALSIIHPIYKETKSYLGLNEVFSHLENFELQNIWEEKVGMELKNSMTQITGQLIKKILNVDIAVLNFFSTFEKKQELKQYQTIYQKINTLSSPELIPYIALKDALAKLI